ncbi:uncharacterized protein C2845_PM03G22760 [Panicum miliaceum]|uniref:Uncharacterized protein n=1 Tax=Panicum miliaceum TaxID=4540 RepID=A0A3L6T7A4_PANMI|nr:uncharacterized protein C2845_PM03G22760 [Panicum miliaceum]
MRVHLYLSEAAAWSPPMYGPQSPVHGVETLPTVLVGNALYFLIDATQSILEYDLATMNMSVIPLPSEHFVDFAVLTTMEDGQLGFARIVGSRLLLWSMKWVLRDMLDGPKSESLSSRHCFLLMPSLSQMIMLALHMALGSFLCPWKTGSPSSALI